MNIQTQSFTFIIFILVGILIGIVFDIFRIIRRSFKTPDFITYIEDILFWIISGALLLFCIFTFNNGELRLYLFVSIILGNLLYLFTLSKYFIKISTYLINILKKILYYPYSIIKKIIKKIYNPLVKFLRNVKINLTKNMKKTIKNIQNPNIRKKV